MISLQALGITNRTNGKKLTYVGVLIQHTHSVLLTMAWRAHVAASWQNAVERAVKHSQKNVYVCAYLLSEEVVNSHGNEDQSVTIALYTDTMTLAWHFTERMFYGHMHHA